MAGTSEIGKMVGFDIALTDITPSTCHNRRARQGGITLSLFGFLKRKPSAALQAVADRELLGAREACRRVFDRNLNVLLQDRDGLSDLLVLAPAYDYVGFNDLFLRGVVDAFMDGQPTLPTEPAARALLHMAAYLVEREEIPLADGIVRAKAAEERYNDNQPIFDAFFDAGRRAYREDSDYRLAETSRRVRNNMIINHS
jgi:hypothetical protein